jgi:lipoprotein-anchoring transpeptidase ErfK/SrfK
VLALVVVLGACAADGGSAAPPATRRAAVTTTTSNTSTTVQVPDTQPVDESFVGHARGPSVAVYESPGDRHPSQVLANPNENGAPLVFLLVRPPAGELLVQAYLPVRPNGSTGWVRSSDLTVTSHGYRLTVRRRSHRLDVTRFGKAVMSVPIAVGTAETPTPGGVFYVKELLRPSSPDGPYGPYAYGLSGFSNVLHTFGTGDGVIGIHGTNEPSSIGHDVSHGCIRLRNATSNGWSRSFRSARRSTSPTADVHPVKFGFAGTAAAGGVDPPGSKKMRSDAPS